MTIPAIITSNSITVLIDGKTLVANSAHPNFNAIREALKTGGADAASLVPMFSIAQAITAKTMGRVTVQNDAVLYDGQPLHTTLTDRMLAMLSEGFNIDPLVNFLEKLMQNPSNRAVLGLYDFLAATNIPITPEGDFLAYKKVRPTYYDIHSNTIRNAVGDEPRVPRNQVDENPDRTCSHGLHVCSASYLPQFGNCTDNRIMIVQVNPADVVAIPRDYNNAKMRCAGYKVISEVPASEVATVFSAPVMGESNFRARAENDLSGGARLESDETDVIRTIGDLLVNFVFYEDDGWYATYEENGQENEVSLISDDLEGAVEEFIDGYMDEVVTYTAVVRWIDEGGDLVSETVTVQGEAVFEPEDWEFFEEVTNEDFESDFARVVNITKGATTLVLA